MTAPKQDSAEQVHAPALPVAASVAVDVLTPLRSHATRREAVADQLRLEIVSGRIPPGTLLRETAVAQRLNVSATPVREAFAGLAAEGLIQIETHRLKRVTPIDFGATHDLLRVQTRLWRFGYEWGMPNVGPEGVAQLGVAIDDYHDALEQKDTLGAIRAAHDFHTVFITASANKELLRSTLDRRSLIARFILLHGASSVTMAGLRQHAAMLACFKRGDSDGVLSRLDELAARLLDTARIPQN